LRGDHCSFQADPARLQQILLNIIGNAVEFTPEGGNIEIATTNPNGTQLTIMITDNGIGMLEDHDDTAQVMGNVLRQMGHEVEICSTVAAASEKVRDREFDVILSDIGLPDGTGIDFIRTAREICQTPAVAITGYGMAEDVEKCLRAGFDEHLTKPISIERLQKTLSGMSRKAASRN
jgi:CheY-like chemotaxis protein